MKRCIKFLLLLLGLLPLLASAQMTHEGETRDRMKVGRHVWKNESGQIRAETVYDNDGVVQSFRTWDEKGLLIDEEKLDPKRQRMEFPEIAWVWEDDGFGYLIIHGHAEKDAPKANAGERVSIYYEGYLQDGTIFDGNYGAKKPLRFKSQEGEVVPGFDRAVSMLKVGEEGYFWLPAAMAYGPEVAGMIPPFSDIMFKIKLVNLN
jgi:hypothetical protein